MLNRWTRVILCTALVGSLGSACGGGVDPGDTGVPGTDAARVDGALPGDVGSGGPCHDLDSDGDGVPDRFLGNADTDGDGIANSRDPDADGDGRTNILEASNGRDVYECNRGSPVDSDNDGTPDILDTDSDGNGRPDSVDFIGEGTEPEGGWGPRPFDWDRDGIPDYADTDDDNDRITDLEEIGGNPNAPSDTDADGTPDFRDNDSDGDTMSDADEGAIDYDADGEPNYRDTDSDGDTILDRDEAGDAVIATPPVECALELDLTNLTRVMPDGIPDFRDIDSDNDGLSDQEELANATNRCNPDSDGDGQLDSAEVSYCRQIRRMGCATDRAMTIPSTDYYLILPNGGPQINRELEFGTNIRVADVFFIFDTTGSMSSVQQAVAATIAAPMTGLVDSIRRVIPDTYFGVGHYDDFPTGSYGGGSDRAIHPLCAGGPGSATTPECSSATRTYGGIIMTPPSGAMDVQLGARAIPGGGGNDGPESTVEALYQIVTNEGLYDRSRPDACRTVGTAPCWVRPTACPEGTWGYPCFRDGSLAIVVQYGDAPWHNGPRDESPPTTGYFDAYSGISPTPHNFDQMIMAFQRRSARQININGNSGQRCEGRLYTNHSGYGPCYDMRMAAEGTGSVDLDGNTLVYDLPPGASTTPPAELVNIVTGAVNTLATRVPLDINTTTRNDPMNPYMVNATRFIKRRVPSCQIEPRNTRCWTEAMGVLHAAAVSRTDLSTFYRVIPGTRVRFTIYFQNDGVYEGSTTGVTLFHAFIDVLGDGVSRLDTRDVYILVPARQPEIG